MTCSGKGGIGPNCDDVRFGQLADVTEKSSPMPAFPESRNSAQQRVDQLYRLVVIRDHFRCADLSPGHFRWAAQQIIDVRLEFP